MNTNCYMGYSSINVGLVSDAPKRGKKGKTLKCWQRNGFYNKK